MRPWAIAIVHLQEALLYHYRPLQVWRLLHIIGNKAEIANMSISKEH
jgi:hypothetical protein